MFQVNDVIIYGTQGVCTITGTDVKSVGGVKKTYYILQPVRRTDAPFMPLWIIPMC
jgi:RNA polymerase-interacting CarD/CdnL/TRCF family regulator